MSGKLFRALGYGLRPDTEEIDYDSIRRLADEHKPRMIVAGASAYSRIIDWRRFREIADSIGAYLFVDMAHYAGLVAARLYPNPVGIADFVTSTTHKTLRGPRGGFILAAEQHAKALNSIVFPALQGWATDARDCRQSGGKEALDPRFSDCEKQALENSRTMVRVLTERGLRIVSGGTDCHMFLVDLRSRKITGKDAEVALGRAQITINKNAIPHDPEKLTVTSGLRVGSAAMTTRGFGDSEAVTVARFVADVLDAPADIAVIARVRAEVQALCGSFPVYANGRS